jgi:asparagine synthase (glutamine-hydrolysing)
LNNKLFNLAAKTTSPFWSIIPKSRNSSLANKSRQAQRYVNGLYLSDKERYWYWSSFAHKKYVDKILVNKETSAFVENKKELLKNIDNNFNSILYSDMNMVLPNDMLFKVDMMSMSHGLEVRVPILDHTIVDFMFTLPSEYKIDKLLRKKLLRAAFGNELPNEILSKPKHGFEIPLLPWLKKELQPHINSYLNKSDINKMGIFDFNEIKLLQQRIHSVNPSDSPIHLWNIFVFQYWCNKYFN